MSSLNNSVIQVIYDGDCPICTYMVTGIRLNQLAELKLVNARDIPEQVAQYKLQGYDLNLGMIVLVDGELYFGDKAISVLGLMATPRGFINRLAFLILREPGLSSLLYPIMVRCRLVLLKIIGRSPI